jgi:sugar O-acyltransferase (sialic acid O-acetyltransferase NeuD family)
MQKLVILGAGGFAEEVADLAADAGFEVVAFVEGIDRNRCARTLGGPPIVWIEDIASLAPSCHAICAIGSTKRSGLIAKAAAANMRFTTVVHPTAHVSSTVTLGLGTLVSAGAVIAAHCRIAAHVIINRGCLVGHHAEVGECATLSPGVNLGGHAVIGSHCYVGMGAVVLEKVQVGHRALVGAGAVVTQDVPGRVQVLGVPARAVKLVG